MDVGEAGPFGYWTLRPSGVSGVMRREVHREWAYAILCRIVEQYVEQYIDWVRLH